MADEKHVPPPATDRASAKAAAVSAAKDAGARIALTKQLIMRELGPCREVSLIVTKLDEAGHWARDLAERIEAGK